MVNVGEGFSAEQGAHEVGLRDGLGSAAGGREVGAGAQRLAAVPAAAKEAAAAARVLHLVLLPRIHLHAHRKTPQDDYGMTR